MAEYIKRSDACRDCVHCTPLVDVEETKHGHWTPVNKQQGDSTNGFWTERYLQCSVCNYERRHSWLRTERPNFCENCGADMRGEQDGKQKA